MFYRWWVVAWLAFFPLISFAFSDFAGYYHCQGFDPYLNKKYTGKVTVYYQNTVYGLIMEYDTGEIYKGTGGQYSPELMSVVFQDIHNLKHVGLEQYTFAANKKIMQGFWVYLGEDKLGTEICEKIS